MREGPMLRSILKKAFTVQPVILFEKRFVMLYLHLYMQEPGEKSIIAGLVFSKRLMRGRLRAWRDVQLPEERTACGEGWPRRGDAAAIVLEFRRQDGAGPVGAYRLWRTS